MYDNYEFYKNNVIPAHVERSKEKGKRIKFKQLIYDLHPITQWRNRQ